MDLADHISNLAEQGERIKSYAMCNECAFRRGIIANLEPATVDTAINALLSPSAHFVCHKSKERLCGGYQMAINAMDNER